MSVSAYDLPPEVPSLGNNVEHVDRPDPDRFTRRQALIAIQGDAPMLYAQRTTDDLIKIGCSGNIARRHYDHGGEMLAIGPGDFDDEAKLHAQLRDHVARGEEYYHPTPAVLAVVNGMRVAIGLDPIAA